MTGTIVDVDAAPELGPRNSQAEGIGRVTALGELTCWNNLGRNVVFADARFRPLAVWASTRFPGEDEPSQYDLDVHAIVDVPDLGLVLVLNHLGCLRSFRRCELVHPGPLREVEPVEVASFAADVERTVVAGNVLVGSRPRSDGAPGVLVSSPLDARALDGPVGVDVAAEELGEVTALAVIAGGAESLVAVGGPGKVALVSVTGGRLERPTWHAAVGFRVTVLAWDGRFLWAAGPARTPVVDDYDWEALHAGGFAALHPADGAIAVAGPLPDDVAWGTGGVPVVPFGGHLAALGRTGRVHLIDPGDPTRSTATTPRSTTSLGMAHADAVGNHLLFGFNRGGYRLHALELTRTA